MEQILIIDNGSGKVKSGFSGEYSPRSIIPSIIGRPKNMNRLVGLTKDEYLGDEAQQKRRILKISYPMEHCNINDWTDMEMIWDHIFLVELRVSSDEYPVLITEPFHNPNANIEKITEIMFETFNVPAMKIAIPGELSIYSEGKTTGIVCESGDGNTHITPVFNGFTQRHAIK